MTTTKKTLYLPRGEDNPYRIHLDLMTTQEWLAMLPWYSFSLRVLLPLTGEWYEIARFRSRDHAYQMMRMMRASPTFEYMVVVQMLRVGKEGREKPILFSPAQAQIEQEMHRIALYRAKGGRGIPPQ